MALDGAGCRDRRRLYFVDLGSPIASHYLPRNLPPQPSCAPDARLGPELLGTVFLVALFAVLMVTGAILQPKGRDKALRALLIVLVIAVVVAPLWTLTGSGFALGKRSPTGRTTSRPEAAESLPIVIGCASSMVPMTGRLGS